MYLYRDMIRGIAEAHQFLEGYIARIWRFEEIIIRGVESH